MKEIQEPFLVLIAFLGILLPAATAETPLSGAPLRRQLSEGVRFSCVDTPFRKAICDLGEANRVAVFVDRRVDPSREIALTGAKSPLWNLLGTVAQKGNAECLLLGQTVYVVPSGSSQGAARVAALRRADVKRLSESARRRLLRPVTLSWEELTTPDQLLTQWEAKTGVDTSALRKEIPHDLWPKGALPTMAPTDALSALLFGFGRTFRFSEDGKSVFPEEIPPDDVLRREVPSSEVAGALNPMMPSTGPRERQSAGHTEDPFARERFTLAVREKPLSAVLAQLAVQLHLDIRWPDVPPAEKAARDRIRCSFSVKKAELDTLLEAMFKDTPYTFSRSGARIDVRGR